MRSLFWTVTSLTSAIIPGKTDQALGLLHAYRLVKLCRRQLIGKGSTNLLVFMLIFLLLLTIQYKFLIGIRIKKDGKNLQDAAASKTGENVYSLAPMPQASCGIITMKACCAAPQ